MTQDSPTLNAQFNFPNDAPVTLFGNAAKRILNSDDPELLLHLNAHRCLVPRSQASPVHTEGLSSRWPTSWATTRRPLRSARFDAIYVADLTGNEPKPVVGRGMDVLHSLTALDLSLGVVNLSPKLVETSPLLARAVHEGQVELIDPMENLGDYRIAALEIEARRDAFEAHLALEAFLDDAVALADRTLEPGAGVARRIGIWQRIRDAIDFDLVVVRDPLAPFGSVSTWNETIRGVRVVSFQHGVISGLHTYVPVLGSTHVTHGPASALLLERLNDKWAPSLSPYHVRPLAFGNFIHRTQDEAPATSRPNLLILDQSNPWSGLYYGFEQQLRELAEVAADVLKRRSTNAVTLRPHPYCTDLSRWLELKSEFGSRLTISHPLVPLWEDIREATVALSLFSGAALATAANGVPTFLMGRNGRPWTPDLTTFAPVTFSHEEATGHIWSILADEDTHHRWANTSFGSAQQYFGDTNYRQIDSATIAQLI